MILPTGTLLALLFVLGAASQETPRGGGVVFELLKVEGAPGKRPIVTFKLADASGRPIRPSDMDALRLILAGPTSDYSYYLADSSKENARGVEGAEEGTYTWQLATPAPEGATGSYAVAITGRRPRPQGGFDYGTNKVTYFSVDGSAVKPRRTVVATEKCNKCHGSLASGATNRVEVCVFCHGPNATDSRYRPPDSGPPESADFRTMIHKIHTGKALKQPYTLWTQGVAHNHNGVEYPGNRRDCDACHVGGSQRLPLRPGLLSVAAPRSPLNPIPPATAACLGCHDGPDAARHAALYIKAGIERCADCHGKAKPSPKPAHES